MAPIKLEEQIKDTLEQRKLQPSSEAWSQLANRLDTQEKSNKKTAFWWLGIAASITLLIAISMPFFNNNSENTSPIIVDVEAKTNEEKELLEDPNIKETVKEVISTVAKDDAVAKSEKQSVTKDINPTYEKENTIVKQVIVNKEEAVAQNVETQKRDKEIIETPLQAIKTFEEVKVLDVVTEIKKMQQEQSIVTDREIDSLLKVAHKEILNQRMYNEITKTVDADALLQDVEEDLEQSFRTKVFEALKSNYSKVKTAVAERNN